MRTALSVMLAALVLAHSAQADASSSDPWWGPDKALHFGVSAGIALGGYGVASLWLEPRWQRAAAGATLALGAGAAKELWDWTGHGDASWRDFAWDVAGTALGVGTALLVDLALSEGKTDSGPHTTALVRF